MKILNFGSCNIDYVYAIDHIVRVGETETTERMDVFPGGKGLNQSIAVARAGAQIWHAGCVGNDGTMLTELLEASGVDLSYMKTVDAKNGHAIIQVSAKGENSIFLYPGSNEMVTKEYVDEVLTHFACGDILLLQNEISNVEYIIRRAYEKQMQIVFNPSPINEKIAEIDLGMISYLILNEVEAGEITHCDNPDESLAYFKKNYPSLKIMLTLGEKGCVYMDTETEVWQSAFKVKAVDTTAAGDTFTGYFVAGIAQGDAYAEILKIASAASAIAVSKNGAAPSIPQRAEVLEKFESLQGN
ncbi:MAG: ribokinase [Clostridia bacterium]|nr:ribokinase [Clostridia bacterium]